MIYFQLLRIVFIFFFGHLQSVSTKNSDMLVDNAANLQHQCSSSPSISNCKNFIKERNKLSIKQSILTKLDLDEEFKNSNFPKVPQKIIDEYMTDLKPEQDFQSDQASFLSDSRPFTPYIDYSDVNENSVSPKSIIIFNQVYPKMRHKCVKRQDQLYFPISNSTLNFNVQTARLHFMVTVKPHHPNKRQNSNYVLQIFKNCYRKTDEPHVLNKFSSTTTSTGHGQTQGLGHNHITSVSVSRYELDVNPWIDVDITKIVTKWFKNNSNNNNGISISVFEDNDNLEVNNGQDYVIKPYITIDVSEKRRTLSKRSVDQRCTEQSKEKHCCRYPLTIDFNEFGWDFVITPRTYEAYYCAGDCPHVYKQHHPHTFITQMSSAAIGPCCSPREYSNMSMLYFDPDLNIRFSNLPGMVVSKCGCS